MVPLLLLALLAAAPKVPHKKPPAPAEPPAGKLVFRSSAVGMATGQATRETWTLTLPTAGRGTLRRTMETGPRGRLDESFWKRTWKLTTDLTFTTQFTRAGLQLTREGAPESDLVCSYRTVPVLPANAVLLPGEGCGGGRPARWSPANAKAMRVWACKTEPTFDGPRELLFLAEPGLEHASENSDCIAQDGAYRLLR